MRRIDRAPSPTGWHDETIDWAGVSILRRNDILKSKQAKALPWVPFTRVGRALGNDRREPVRPLKTILAAGSIAAFAMLPAAAADISGAGATFPYPIYAKWAD